MCLYEKRKLKWHFYPLIYNTLKQENGIIVFFHNMHLTMMVGHLNWLFLSEKSDLLIITYFVAHIHVKKSRQKMLKAKHMSISAG